MRCQHRWKRRAHGSAGTPGVFSDFCGGIVVLEKCAKCGREKRTRLPASGAIGVSYRNPGGEWGPEGWGTGRRVS